MTGRDGDGEQAERRLTYCRICEALCGLVVHVEGDQVVKIEADRDHPVSRGFACTKGLAMAEVQHDPDRLLYPMRRTGGPGQFERVSWDEALADIAARLRRLLAEHGPEAFAVYMGNPAAFSHAHVYWLKGFADAIGTPHYYAAASQDTNNLFAASHFLYGTPLTQSIPDLAATDFLLMLGANPVVSQGSLLNMAARVREHLLAITDRGGRVVVVDPRRSETARLFEHVAIRADTDALMLLSMLSVIFEDGLADDASLEQWADGRGELEKALGRFGPEQTAARTGIAPAFLRELARSFATAPTAVAYGRTGTCTGRFGTLTAYLIGVLNAVTGNLDRRGGALFASPAVAFDRMANAFGLATYGKVRSRVGGFPDVIGFMPAAVLPAEILTPGRGQVRALLTSAGNPLLSVPDQEGFEAALPTLDLHVSLDLYMNETNRHADYLLPATTFLEREDAPVLAMDFMVQPFIQLATPVVRRAGETREEWEVLDDLARRIGLGGPFSIKAARVLARLGLRITPRRVLDVMLRTGPYGDWFGLRRSGLSVRMLERLPRGKVLREQPKTGQLRSKIKHADGRVHLAEPELLLELDRLDQVRDDPDYPMRLIGMRERRSHNSWMHNAPRLMRHGSSQRLRLHPSDAAAAGVSSGDLVHVASRTGTLRVPAEVTDEMIPGTAALPHGWGHAGGGWEVANRAGGANYNRLTSSAVEHIEQLSGMSHLNGIAVRITPAPDPTS